MKTEHIVVIDSIHSPTTEHLKDILHAVYGGAVEVYDRQEKQPQEQSQQSFFAGHQYLGLGCYFYAENIHHAGNKALKQWGTDVIVFNPVSRPRDIYKTVVVQTKFTAILKAYYSNE